MAEFEAGVNTYRTKRANGRQQLHILHALGPLAVPMMQQVVLGNVDDQSRAAGMAYMMLQFFQSFTQMKQADVDHLVDECFNFADRRTGGNGAALWAPLRAGGRDAFEDIDVDAMFMICFQVVQENIGSFFAIATPPVAVTDTPAAPPASPG